MNLNITAGEALNQLLRQEGESWVPFNEALQTGSFQSPLFSEFFLKERARELHVSEEEYSRKLSPFLTAIEHLDNYTDIHLWFGNDDFCRANVFHLLRYLREQCYSGQVHFHLTEEVSGKEIFPCRIDLYRIVREVRITVLHRTEFPELKKQYEQPGNSCDMQIGTVYFSRKALLPDGFCPSAFLNLEPYLFWMDRGGYSFYGDWLKNPNQVMVSCNDGIRPVSFLLESIVGED